MVKELYQTITRELTLNVTNGKVDSVRKKNIIKSGCRIYADGCIGVAGTLGEPDENTWRSARNALSLSIPCPSEPKGQGTRRRRIGVFPKEDVFLAQAEAFLDTLSGEFPGFVFSNKIRATEETYRLRNDLGTDFEDCLAYINVGLIVKEESSPNVFDTCIDITGQTLDMEQLLDKSRAILRAHQNPLPMPREALPAILSFSELFLGVLQDGLNGVQLHKGASQLSGKVGEKIFDDKFTLSCDRGETMRLDGYAPFFDPEGTVLAGDCIPLIQNGVLLRSTADKQCQADFGADLTASATGEYDDVPALDAGPSKDIMHVTPTGSLEEILDGQDGIFVYMAQGGDASPAWNYATPVQAAYLYRGGRLIGRLPEFNFSGSLYDLLGKDYMGCVRDSGAKQFVVVKGKIM